MSHLNKGPGLYEFLSDAELQHYYTALKNELKIQHVGQLKFVSEEDLIVLGMSKPEVRRLKKYFQKLHPQNYLSKFKKILLPHKESLEDLTTSAPSSNDERTGIRVPSKHIIPSDAIVINKELGVGEFGVVQQGVWTNEDGERIQVAIKCLTKERMQTQPMEFLKEAAIMHTINCEHIVRLYGVVLDTSALMLVTELAPLRSLLECIKEPSLRVSFPVVTLSHFSIQICDGMTYLETQRLIHRDLAARNILVFAKNKVKISDFGLSRALGVGKDYYQTNFNVNLKLPIAWCAPECINYLRFTSASDVWAFGVTLWEMFSYGFQPWAALTGQQILETIDEPNFQRLEQPETCPKEFYTVMLKCWQHDPLRRPKFVDLMDILVECKPEQVQAIRDWDETLNVSKRERLVYVVRDVITVLDKRPIAENPSIWKGVLNNGKTGLFSAHNTVAYLGTNIPSNKSSFYRTDSDTKSLYSSRRRLRPEMISGPQGDFKHTGHIGLDGAYFGDVSFLDKYHQLPKQIVTPYKPSEDNDQTSLLRASSDASDRAPLLKRTGDRGGKTGPAGDELWETGGHIGSHWERGGGGRQCDHEYHEISDEDDDERIEFHRETLPASTFDFGPSLMEEVFKALGSDPSPLPPLEAPPLTPGVISAEDETINVRNEIKEITNKFLGRESTKRKQAVVKPISAADERTLDSAIAMANELASKSMQQLDWDSSAESDNGPESPVTPNSPGKHPTRFSFKMHKSPRLERRQFSVEAQSIPDIQACISQEAKEVYNSLVERQIVDANQVLLNAADPTSELETESNPLRMLRSGLTVRPKIRGNKHNSGVFTTVERNRRFDGTGNMMGGLEFMSHQTLPRGFKTQSMIGSFSMKPDVGNNPLPLPPRDRSRLGGSVGTGAGVEWSKPRHQRKHPLIIPGGLIDSFKLRFNGTDQPDGDNGTGGMIIHHTHNPHLLEGTEENLFHQEDDAVGGLAELRLPPAKPPRLFTTNPLDDSFENQVASAMDALDDLMDDISPPSLGIDTFAPHSRGGGVTEEFFRQGVCGTDFWEGVNKEILTTGSLCHSSDHVSCEDLLEFALDRPDSRRTKGPLRGAQSDEVHIMIKILGKEGVTPEDCLVALNECQWDVHRAIKLIRLQESAQIEAQVSANDALKALVECQWDAGKALVFLRGEKGEVEK